MTSWASKQRKLTIGTCLLLLWGIGPIVWASDIPTISVHGVVQSDFRTIEGLIHMESVHKIEWVDPLAHLPNPTDDLYLSRTFPDLPNQGHVQFRQITPDTWAFHTELPHRYGDIGSTQDSLLANGGWYPQPIINGHIPTVHWDVLLSLPDSAIGAVSNTSGKGLIHWEGTAERIPIAAYPKGHITQLGNTESPLIVLSSRPLKKRLRALLTKQSEDHLAVLNSSFPIIAIGPLHRRLVRSGPGLTYMSQRAYQVTPGLERLHHTAILQSVLASTIPQPHPFERALAARVLLEDHRKHLHISRSDRLFSALSWLPEIDAMIHSQRTPFYAEILEQDHSGDKLGDDLCEMLDPYTPGAVVWRQLQHQFGMEKAKQLGRDLAQGRSLDGAAEDQDIPMHWFDQWRGPYLSRHYTLQVSKKDRSLNIHRSSTEEVPPESITLDINKELKHVLIEQAITRLPLDANPRQIVLDPHHHLNQPTRLRDGWPNLLRVTLSMWIRSFDLRRGVLDAYGTVGIRRRYDTHNRWLATLYTYPENPLALRLAYVRSEGPLLDGWRRPHQFLLSIMPSFLELPFDTDSAWPMGIEAAATYVFDNRVSQSFPLQGHRVQMGVKSGFSSATQHTWTSFHGQGSLVGSFHPHHTLGIRMSIGHAITDFPLRKLPLGGTQGLMSLPAQSGCSATQALTENSTSPQCGLYADSRVILHGEYRWSLFQNQSIPLFLAWIDGFHIALGVEGMAAMKDTQPLFGVGVTAGLRMQTQLLGVEPRTFGITAAWPLTLHGMDYERSPIPELYFHLDQVF